MGIFTDAFTGQPTKDAAAQQRNYYDSQGRLVTGQIASAQDKGLAALQSGQTSGVDAIRAGTQTGRGDVSQATSNAVNYLNSSTDKGAGALQSGQEGGLAELRSGVDNAANSWNSVEAGADKYGGRATRASDLYESALGITDPTLAQNSFTTGPGYKFATEQGLEGVARNAAAGGMVAGGNQLRAAAEYSTNAANQEYQKYLDNVYKQQSLYAPLEAQGRNQAAGGKSNAYLTGATKGADIYTGTAGKLADLYNSQGKTGAGIYANSGQSLADLASRGGSNEASIFANSGKSQADLIQGLTGQMTDYQKSNNANYGSTYSAEASAAEGGSNNLWNLIGGGAKLAAKAYGQKGA